jgi:hypothetical protein
MLKTMAETKAGRRAGAVLLLIGVTAGAAGAQGIAAVADMLRNEVMGTSLFSVLPDEKADFNVTLQADGGPNSTVVMRLMDPTGAVVARKTVSLAPGESATLRHRAAGRYRAQADVFDEIGVLTDRRTVVSTVEIGGVDDLTAKPRFVCGPGDQLDIPIR